MSNHHHQTGGSLSAPRANRNIPTNSGSISPSNHNAVSNHSNGNKRPRVHPPLHERSRNARAQARHRAKRKAYILQLEETVTRLQAALSPNQPFNTSFTSAAAAGSPSASSNDQSQSSLGIPLSSPSTLPNALGNAMIGIGLHPAVGKGSPGSADVVAARFRAIELECSALRTYAETLRGLLGQHTPNVQLPPPPLPSSLPPSASATTTGPSSLHSGLGLGSGAGEALPSLISTFPSAPTSSSPSCHRADTSEKIAGIKRPRRESHSRSLSASGSGTDREGGEGSNFSTGGGELGYTVTPPLNSKPSASGGPVTGTFPHSGVNSYTNTNTGGHPSQLTLPPLPPSQPAPVPPYTYGSNQSQQPLSSPLPMQQQHQHQQHSSQPQSNSAHTSTHSQPQMTPMPPPAPSWGSSLGASSVPSHGNNSVHTHLQLPPPIPRLNPTSTMPSLTRGFAYPSDASSPSARQEGLDGSSNTDRNRFGSFSGGVIGTALGGASMVLKREEDHDPGLPVNMHASGRHQHHESFESIHSISPTSATATSPSSAIPQEHYHAQIPSPQGHHTYQHPQQPSAAQRLLPSPVPHQNHQTHSHYSHHTSVPTVSQPSTQHQHAHHHQNQPLQVQQPHHHQQSAPAHGLPSPHSPYPPVSPGVPAVYRGYQEERYHHPSQPDHQHGHAAHQQGQNQNHTANYLWTTTQAGAVYGGR